MGEGDEIHIYRQQHQLDRHENGNHILPVQKNTDYADRKQDRSQNKIM
jgi:hypothetical protein